MQITIPQFQLPLTANSGQCFRFNEQEDSSFVLISKGRVLKIFDLGNDLYEFSCGENEFESVWHRYFDMDRDYKAVHSLAFTGDTYLQKAADFAKGVRILRQDPFETLMAFIISQRKTIPSIKSCVEKLSERFGEPLGNGSYAFPMPVALASADDQALRECSLGYRLPYIKKSAQMVASGEVDPNAIAELDDAGLEHQLLRFPGVGKKVAACVMLFSYGRMNVFPVDTWIQKVLDSQYQDGFPYEQFDGVTGILQQYLFCYARHLAGRG